MGCSPRGGKGSDIILPLNHHYHHHQTMLSDVGQAEKDKLCDITYMWNIKNTINSEYKKREADS